MSLKEFTVAIVKCDTCDSHSSFTAFPQTHIAILVPTWTLTSDDGAGNR